MPETEDQENWRQRQAREHFDNYDGIARVIGIDTLFHYIPADEDVIARALADGDDDLNTIPLRHWDQNHGSVKLLARRSGYKSWPLSYSVCLLKHVARTYFVKRNDTLTIMGQSHGKHW